MIRYVPVYRSSRGDHSFVPAGGEGPVALIAVACRWDTRPVRDDLTGRLYLPRLRADFSAWGFLEAARHRLFRLRLRWEATRPRPRGRNRARATGGAA